MPPPPMSPLAGLTGELSVQLTGCQDTINQSLIDELFAPLGKFKSRSYQKEFLGANLSWGLIDIESACDVFGTSKDIP